MLFDPVSLKKGRFYGDRAHLWEMFSKLGDIPQDMQNSVMHAEFKSDGLFFMATDGQAAGSFILGNNMHLNLQVDSVEEQNVLFEKLSEGGTVTMPLQQTFWDARFGMLTDRFGIQWMLNVMKNA